MSSGLAIFLVLSFLLLFLTLLFGINPKDPYVGSPINKSYLSEQETRAIAWKPDTIKPHQAKHWQ